MRKISVYIAVSLFITGCATIISGSSQTVRLNSVPDGASVSITNRSGVKIHSVSTPTTLSLNRGAGYFKPEIYKVVFQKEGFQEKEILVTGQVNGWYFGNIILGGVILGMLIVDPLTGAMFSLSPEKVDEALSAVGSNAKAEDGTLTVVLLQEIPSGLLPFVKPLN